MRRSLVVSFCLFVLSAALAQSHSEAEQANVMRHRMNVNACGIGLSTCDPSLLTGTFESGKSTQNGAAYGASAAASKPVGPATSWTAATPFVPTAVAENGSYFGQLNANGVPKTLHVNGYF